MEIQVLDSLRFRSFSVELLSPYEFEKTVQTHLVNYETQRGHSRHPSLSPRLVGTWRESQRSRRHFICLVLHLSCQSFVFIGPCIRSFSLRSFVSPIPSSMEDKWQPIRVGGRVNDSDGKHFICILCKKWQCKNPPFFTSVEIPERSSLQNYQATKAPTPPSPLSWFCQ